ncbi:nitrate- and nitrite sensing domain-containing protein [Actinocrispum sp. NPDC049592]|uniref:sensor histidine kinase n=1 Tax=Actinocrispum sp. NPDC049592 TaxID=3154835 RepID=UPI00342C25E1
MNNHREKRPKSRLLWIHNWPLRVKLTMVLVLPTVVAVVLAAGRVEGELSLAGQAAQASAEVTVLDRARAVVHALQRERDLTIARAAPADVDQQRRQTDAAVAAFDEEVADAPAGLDADGRIAEAQRRLHDLPSVRRSAGSAGATPLTATLTPLLSLDEFGTRLAGEATIRRTAAALGAVGRVIEQAQFQHTVLSAAGSAKTLPDNEIDALRVADARERDATATLREVSTDEQRTWLSAMVDQRLLDQRDQLKTAALARARSGGPPGLDPQVWRQASQPVLDQLLLYETKLAGAFGEAVRALDVGAKTQSLRDTALVIGALLLGLMLTLYFASTMLRPLWTLRRRALDVAHRELPRAIERIAADPGQRQDVRIAPVPVHSGEEIGQVARAFDEVHASAMRLAAEQSALRHSVNEIFVSLSRRTQNLVETQLRMIDTMEADELDPEQLDRLFKLDHLATRMRRNSENLLVLAGATLRRTTTRTIDIADVVRAAISEVEQYTRAVVRPTPDVVLLGPAVNDVIHLLAELLDNATTFSPPETQVVVVCAVRPGGEVCLEVSDEGVGMSPSELDTFNRQLAAPAPIEAAMSNRMGLFVVARLATRRGITVRLRAGVGAGTVAEVTLPADLVRPTPSDTDTVPDGQAVTTTRISTIPVALQAIGVHKRYARDTSATDSALADLPPTLRELTKAWFHEEGGRTGADWPEAPTTVRHKANPGSDTTAPADADSPGHTAAGLPRRLRGAQLIPRSHGHRGDKAP